MIETIDDCNRFEEECVGDWILHVVPVSDGVHPITTFPSIVFIHCLATEKTYYYAFDHPDSNSDFNPELDNHFESILSKRSNKKWVLDKKSTLQLLPSLTNVYDANLCGWMKKNEILDCQEFNTSAHELIHRNYPTAGKINKIIPLMKHLESFTSLCDSIKKMIRGFKIESGYEGMNNIILPILGELEKTGLFVDKNEFKTRFHLNVNSYGLTHTQYNVYTSTGRPSNRFGGVNYAALNAKDGSRKCFVSRYGKDGRIVVIDYTAFHPRIICNLTKYDLPVGTNIYEYLAKLYFNKKVIDEVDISNAKKLTFRQFFGGVEDKYHHIKYLANLKNFIDTNWQFFNENGYVLTPIFKRKITNKHITDPDPPKVFNYILQATEGEVSIPKIAEVQSFLKDKKTKAVLYTYDSVIYDFHRDDGLDALNEIRRIMSYDGKFPMKTYVGESYHSVHQAYI